jgi:uncharacterized protein YqgV (UPF0045/DUF77 family)
VPVPPSELNAQFTIHPADEGMAGHVRAGVDAARASGLALEIGPSETALSGAKTEVLDALRAVLDASIEAGAQSIEVKLETSTETRHSSEGTDLS